MAYNIIQQGDTYESYVMGAVTDTLAELETLPKKWRVGSYCLVLENSSVWMLGSDKEWHEID